MHIPILAAKLEIPQVPASYVSRPRLDGLWSSWRGRRVVLVTAGAGFGKTAFLAGNARSGLPCAWYSLEEEDRDPAIFAAHLMHAIDPSRSGVEGSGAEIMAALLQRLHASSRHLPIVLDDAHVLCPAADVLAFLERLIRLLPPAATLILSSREPLPIRSLKLRAEGVVAAVTARDLRFTEQELAALVARRIGPEALSARALRRIAERTEGWAAGIEILLQMLEGTSDATVERALRRLEESGSNWFDYFAEEVVSRLDDRTRDFLARSSVLPRLEAGLCNRVLGLRSSQSILEELHERNLFTYAVGKGRRAFRYHHLFRAFLADQLSRKRPAAEVQALQRRAAAALVRAGQAAEALAVLAEAGDHDGALQLVERVGERLLETGRDASLREAFGRIPDGRLRGRYEAQFVLAVLRDIEGRWDEAASLYRRVLRHTPRGVRRAEVQWRLGRLHLRWGRYARGEELCRRALRDLDRRRIPLRGDVLNALGVACGEQGRMDEGEASFAEAAALYRALGDPVGQARASCAQAANIHMPRGEFQQAKVAARRALAVFRRRRDNLEISRCLAVLGFTAAVAGDVTEANELAAEGLRLAESFGYPYLESYCHCALGRGALLEVDLDRAREHFAKARELGELTAESDLLLHPRIGLAEVALASGNRHAAARLASEAREIARSQGDRLQEGQCLILLGLAEPAPPAGRPAPRQAWELAETLLREAQAHFELHRLLILRLAARDLPEERRTAALRELLRQAAHREHDALFLRVEPERAAAVLAEALRDGIESDYARQILLVLGKRAVAHVIRLLDDECEATRARAIDLLTRIGGDEARESLARVARAAVGASRVARVARRAVRELDAGPRMPLRVEALGSLRVLVGPREIAYQSWRSRRALRLFQLLLVHGFEWVARDVVIETLWPGSDPQLSGNNLRQTLHVLRRTLEPDLARTAQSQFVRQHSEAYRLLPGEGHAYDVEEFLGLLREGDALWRAGERREAETLLARAIDLYRGDFLEESPYEDFVAARREELRERLVRALQRLLSIYALGRRWEEVVPLCRRALLADPCREEFHWQLVQAQLRLGHRVEALAAYHHYEQRMVRDLGILPAERMRALAEEAAALSGGDRARGTGGPSPSRGARTTPGAKPEGGGGVSA